jgi:hypothetical protein
VLKTVILVVTVIIPTSFLGRTCYINKSTDSVYLISVKYNLTVSHYHITIIVNVDLKHYFINKL